MAAIFEPKLRDTQSDLVEEMEGIAEGAGVDFMSVLALNVRSE
jgi:isopenicillin-N N-acyltransferase-like protein